MLREIRLSLRHLIHNPAFSITAIVSLMVAIGGGTAVFSVVNTILLNPLPLPQSHRVIRVFDRNLERNLPRFSVSVSHFEAWKKHSHSFEQMGAYREDGFDLLEGNEPERLVGLRVTPGIFEVLGIRPQLGNWFRDPGVDAIVISDSLWTRRFGRHSDILGRRIIIDGTPRTVAAVTPVGFRFPQQEAAEVFLPYQLSTDLQGHFLRVLGRLRRDLTIEAALAELTAISTSGGDAGGGMGEENWTAWGQPLQELMVGSVRGELWLAALAVAIVVLGACVNISNLFLTQLLGRRRELSVRLSLGATRRRLVGQILRESLILSAVGGSLGFVIAVLGVSTLPRFAPEGVPRIHELGIDLRVVGFTFSLTLLCGLLASVLPALRFSSADPAQGLAGRGSGESRGSRRIRDALVAFETAVALTLLVLAGLVTISFSNRLNEDLLFEPEDVVSFELSPQRGGYPQAGDRSRFFGQVVDRISSIPGVTAVGLTHRLPLTGSSSMPLRSADAMAEDPPVPNVSHYVVTPGFLEALGYQLREGRLPSRMEAFEQGNTVVVNRRLADLYFPGEASLGKRVGPTPNGPWLTIVGVIENVRDTTFSGEFEPVIYYPYALAGIPSMMVVVKTQSGVVLSAQQVQEEVATIDARQPIAAFQSLDEHLGGLLAWHRFSSRLMTLFAALALLLTMVGVYGLFSFSVRQRRHEVAIRIAVGADQRNVLAMLARYGLSITVPGVVLGVGLVLGVGNLLEGLLYGIEPSSPTLIAASTLIIVAATLIAMVMPARQICRTDPVQELKAS